MDEKITKKKEPLSPRQRKIIAIALLAVVIIFSVGGSVLLVFNWELVEQLQDGGFIGLFLISLFAGSPIPIPTPSMVLTFTMGSLLHPALVGLVAFLLAMASRSGGLGSLDFDVVMPIIWVLNMVVVFGLFALITGVARFFIMGILYALPLPLIIGFRELADIRIGYWSFAVPGALVVLMGIWVLVRFLKEYPPLTEEV